MATFSVTALTAASAAYWVLKWSAAAPEAPTLEAPLASTPQADARVVARLLGGAQQAALAGPSVLPTASASQFKLLGVVTEGRHGGYALIAINDQPAKPYRVGAAVGDQLVLHSVAARSAALASSVQASASVQLVLPALAPAQEAPTDR
jgi:general secretion pathway protein C